MSIASAIENAQQKVANAYTAISNKGGTLPQTQNLANMPTAINSISGGGGVNNTSLSVTPSTSSQSFTPTAPYTGYSPVNVSAVTSSIDNNITAGNIKKDVTILGVTGTYDGGGGSGYTELPSYQVVNGVASKRSGALTGNEFSNITSINDYGLQYSFYENMELSGNVNLSSVTSIGNYGLYNAFFNDFDISSVNLSSLTTVGNYGLYNAFGMDTIKYSTKTPSITTIDLSSLTTVGTQGMYRAFWGCSSLAGVLDLSSLTTAASLCFIQAFYKSKITKAYLTSLNYLQAQALNQIFNNCTLLEDVYFNSLTTSSFANVNAFQNMLLGTGNTKTHTLHFPSNLETTISGLTGYPLFGGSSGKVTLLFDLPATS